MTTVEIPQHHTPRGVWCPFSGADSLSGICWTCELAPEPESPPPGTLQFYGIDGWHTARRPPGRPELEAAARGTGGQFWLTGFTGEPYNANAPRSIFDRLVRVTEERQE